MKLDSEVEERERQRTEGRKMVKAECVPAPKIESDPMSRDRKEIYLGAALRRLLKTRPKDSLTTIVNLVADRYLGMLERLGHTVPCTVREEDVYRAVLAETRGRRLEAREIALFANMVSDWLARNPEYPQSAYERVRQATFVELVALIERLERQ